MYNTATTMSDKISRDTKCTRIAFYWNELSQHGIDPEVSLAYMEYVFNVKRARILRIIKGYVFYRKVELPHPEIESANVDAFVRKLYRAAHNEKHKNNQVKV
jgi:hypothetical protein